MEEDLAGAGYNVNQSKIAIGSGGLTGKGFLNGTQTKLKYVPEQDTDFIFCTVGEEEGFVGSVAVLLLFLVLILRLMAVAERQPSTFGRVYGYSVVSIFLFHLFINIGMVLGLTPVIGIPLPFFSYGGSSLWGFTILLFIFLRIDAGRKKRLDVLGYDFCVTGLEERFVTSFGHVRLWDLPYLLHWFCISPFQLDSYVVDPG